MKLLFVYNAKSGVRNALLDVGHKLFSPNTYPCSLCALTYDTFSENKLWKAFRKTSNIEMEFLHKDEFEAQYPKEAYKYPIILSESDSEFNVIMNAETLDNSENLESLITSLSKKINL